MADVYGVFLHLGNPKMIKCFDDSADDWWFGNHTATVIVKLIYSCSPQPELVTFSKNP